MNGRPWTKKEENILREKYPHVLSAKLAVQLNRSVSSLYGRADLLGLSKTDAFRRGAESGRMQKGHLFSDNMKAVMFKKGHIPQNKGLKQSQYMSKEAIARTKATRFKKGQLPAGTLHHGAITVRRDKGGRYYKWIRIDKGKWKMLHVDMWEKKNGLVPPGHIIIFKDGNSLNVFIENLEKITLAENMKRNTIHQWPPELRKTISVLTKLKKKVYGKKQNQRSKGSPV